MTQADVQDMKDFYNEEYQEEQLGGDFATLQDNGIYHVSITKGEVETGTWENSGNPFIHIPSKVVCGEAANSFAPRVQRNIGDEEGTREDGSTWGTSAADNAKRLRVQIKAIHPGQIAIRNGASYDLDMLEDFALGLNNDGGDFIIQVRKNAQGFFRVQRVHALASPPRDFTCSCVSGSNNNKATWTP